MNKCKNFFSDVYTILNGVYLHEYLIMPFTIIAQF